MSCVKTFRAGEEFIKRHKDSDQWYLQIESFDPHEPFYVPDQYRSLYDLKGPQKMDWPAYGPVDAKKSSDELDEMRREYASLVTMCDHYLGEVLDLFDEYNLWKDTLLIVNTDHGFLLGEHDLMGKNFPPMYDELIHLPFFIHVPEDQYTGDRQSLSQTIDVPATLLDYFGVQNTEDMDGHSLRGAIETGINTHDYTCFGGHGSSFGITDGHYKYFKAANKENQPFVECTLMPTNMRGFFSAESLKQSILFPGDRFSHGIPYLKVNAKTYMNSFKFGNLLFDLDHDPDEKDNLLPNNEIEEHFKQVIRRKMEQSEAPEEEYQRLEL